MLTKKVFTPGPTQVPEEVFKAVIGPVAYHRSEQFKTFHYGLISKLKSIFFTSAELNVLTTSGTGSMEAAVVNFCNTGDKTLYINQGRFGNRWGNICREFGIPAEEVFIKPGSAISVDDLRKVKLNGIDAVFFTHVETSTATVTDLTKVANYVRNNSDALVIVDSVTSIGTTEFRMDEWGIDVAVSASQKGLMTPPGLSVVAYSERAKKKMLGNSTPRFYLDLRKEYKAFQDGLTSWTPAVGIMYGLNKACDIIMEYGIEKWWAKVSRNAAYFRNECLKMGLHLFSRAPADSLTALLMPDSIPSGKLITSIFNRYGARMANGQAELKDKIFRVSHMGDVDLEDFKQLAEIIKEELEYLRK